MRDARRALLVALAALAIGLAPAAALAAPLASSAQTHTVTETATTTTTATSTMTTSTVAVSMPSARPAAAPTALEGWLSPTADFPQRAFVLEEPAGGGRGRGDVTVEENGRAVGSTTVDPLTDPGRGDYGIVLTLATGRSATGAPLTAELDTAWTLVAGRSPAVAFGALGDGATVRTIAPLTTDATRLRRALAAPTSAGGPGAGRQLSATALAAVSELVHARVAFGLVIVVSDGVGVSGSSAALAAAAAADHVKIVTIGLEDGAATARSLQALSHWAPGTFLLSTPSGLPAVAASAESTLARSYSVLRYRSAQAPGSHVSVQVAATHVPGAVTADYRAPGAAKAAGHASHRRHAATTPAGPHTTSALTPTPGFASASAVTDTTIPASGAGFWHSGAGVLIIAVLMAALIGAGVLFALRRPGQDAVRTRVGSYTPAAAVAAGAEGQGEESARGGLLGILQRGTWWPGFVEAVEVSRNPKSPGFLMKRAGVVAIVAAALFVLVTHVVALGLLPLLAFPFVQRWLVTRQATKQRIVFSDTLPSYMQDIASAIRVGRSLVSAIAVVADSAEEPTRSELERAVTDEALGRPLEESLSAVGVRMQSTDMDQFAMIAELNRRSGSNVAEALDRVAEGARERAELRREMRALTAQSKMSSSVLTGMPFVLLLGLSVIAPEYSHPLFHTLWGVVSLLFALTLIGIGWKVMKKISNVGV